MKKSDKLSFSKKGVILLILFAIYNSTFAFDFMPAYGTGINCFSGHNGSFKLTLNVNTKQKKKQIVLTHSVSLFENSKVYDTKLVRMYAFQYKENNNKDSIPFASPVNYATEICPSSVFCTDLDGDTYSDLAVATGEGVSILINNGDGTFQAKVDYPIGPNTEPMSIYCADLDNDQDMDIAVAAYYQIAIWMNNGDGTFAEPIYSGDLGNHYYSIFCTDLDGDNDIDLAAADAAWNAVFIVINNGDGTFEFDVNNHFDVGDWPRSVFCSDLDGDLDFDIVTANQNSNDISVLINNGNATFENAVNYETGVGSNSVFCSDIDGDLNYDIIAANADSISILINIGDGTFENAINYFAGNNLRSVFCADLDLDEDMDVAVAYNTGVSILQNNGNGILDDLFYYETGTNPVSVFCADMNEDSDFDIALANWSSDDVSVLENLLQVSSILPAESFLHLLNNYPNPFYQSTVIDYQLSVTCEVILRIYDMHGQEVITLVNKNQPAGNHSVFWDGKDNSGNKIKPGVYFYQLKTENYSTVKKLLLIK